jgi:hypothetical protein
MGVTDFAVAIGSTEAPERSSARNAEANPRTNRAETITAGHEYTFIRFILRSPLVENVSISRPENGKARGV